MTYLRPHTPIEHIYKLIGAIYQHAESEAQGNLSHWSVPIDERWKIQLEAYEFANEWRAAFAGRLPGVELDPLLPPVPPKSQWRGGGRKKGERTVVTRAVEYIRWHGPITAQLLALALNTSYPNTTHMLKSHPWLFKIVGKRASGVREWQQVSVWGLVE